MNAKIADFSEMENILSVKSETNDGIITLFGRFGLGNQLRHLSLEKVSGINAVTLIISLCLFRINGVSIFGAYRQRFNGLLDTGKSPLPEVLAHAAGQCPCRTSPAHTKSSRRKMKAFFLLSFSDLSHHRTCRSAYGGSYFGYHSR